MVPNVPNGTLLQEPASNICLLFWFVNRGKTCGQRRLKTCLELKLDQRSGSGLCTMTALPRDLRRDCSSQVVAKALEESVRRKPFQRP